eukprot:g27004.t1
MLPDTPSLVTQYRAQILALQHRSADAMGTKDANEKVNTLKDQIRRLNDENLNSFDPVYLAPAKTGETQQGLAASVERERVNVLIL